MRQQPARTGRRHTCRCQRGVHLSASGASSVLPRCACCRYPEEPRCIPPSFCCAVYSIHFIGVSAAICVVTTHPHGKNGISLGNGRVPVMATATHSRTLVVLIWYECRPPNSSTHTGFATGGDVMCFVHDVCRVMACIASAAAGLHSLRSSSFGNRSAGVSAEVLSPRRHCTRSAPSAPSHPT